MSDYLTSLATRSLNAAPFITPRLASWFEPPSARAGLAARPTLEAEDSESETAPKSSRQTEEPDRTAKSPSRVGDLLVPRVDSRELPERQRKKSDAGQYEPKDQNPVRPRLDNATNVTPRVSSSTTPPVNQTDNQLASMRLSQNPEDVRVPQPPTTSRPITVEASSHKKGSLLEPELKRIGTGQLASFEPAESVERVQSQSPSLIAVAARVAPPTRPADKTAPEAPSNAEPPAIRVTIGRVDVKAIMPQTPAPRPATARPHSLSLADYLKQREGGRR